MQYKVNVSFAWEINTIDAKSASEEGLEQLKPIIKTLGIKTPKIQVHLVGSKTPNKKNKVLAEFPPNEIFSQIGRDGTRKNFQIDSKIYKVKMNSDRYFCFKQNVKCVSCGLEGIKFLLELPNDCQYPHLNFYAEENGEFVLMTKDHKMPIALGGKDLEENYQTMCAICNNLKGKDLFSIKQINELRKIYNKNYGKKNLNEILEIKRNELRGIYFYRYFWFSVIILAILVIALYSTVTAIFGLILAIFGYCLRK